MLPTYTTTRITNANPTDSLVNMFKGFERIQEKRGGCLSIKDVKPNCDHKYKPANIIHADNSEGGIICVYCGEYASERVEAMHNILGSMQRSQLLVILKSLERASISRTTQ